MTSTHHPFSPKMCGPAKRYYCCNCSFGPLSVAVDAACVRCQHWKCSGCCDEFDTIANLTVGATVSEPEPTTLLMCASSNSDGSIQPSPAASLTAFCRDNLSQANIIHETFSNDTPSDGEVYWYCCSCGDGPKTTTINPGCICGHWRCSGCRVTSGK